MTTTQKATLKPYVEEIRQWVAQGRTDIWIAHALNSTPASISAFRSANGILRRDVATERTGAEVPPPVAPPDAAQEEPETRPRRRSRRKAPEPTPLQAAAEAAAGPQAERVEQVERVAVTTTEAEADKPNGRRRRRGGRGRRGGKPQGFEATLDTGDEGFGFWLDGAVREDPVFAENWVGRRALIVRIEADQIVIRPDDRE